MNTKASTPTFNEKTKEWEIIVDESGQKLLLSYKTEKEAQKEARKYINDGIFHSEKKTVLELTNEQKALVLKAWNGQTPPSIIDLIKIAWPESTEEMLDTRTKYGKAIKQYLTEKDLKIDPPKIEIVNLSEEHKEYLRNNCSNMKAFEMAKVIFENSRLSPADKRVKLVINFLKEEVEPEQIYEGEDLTTGEYSPPKRIEHVCARINEHVSGAKYDSKNLTPTHKKQTQALLHYLNNLRFYHHYNLINNDDDKKLFENTFIKYVYDKTDLSQEDLDQYLTLANEAVMESSIKRNIAMLENEQTTTLQNTQKLSMTLVDAVKVARDEYNACRNRQDKLYKALEVERSKRLNERIGPEFTLLAIVEEMKNEERRKSVVQDAEKRNDKIKGEIKRLSSMEERIVRIFGIDESTIIDG